MRRLSLVLSLTALAATALATSNARAADPLKLGGLDLKVDGLSSLGLVGRLDSSTPREQPDFLVRLDAALAWPGKAKFSSTTSFLFDGTLIDSANKYFVRDLDHVFQDTNPSLDFEEAYIDILLPSVDLRVGKQMFSWGKLDALPDPGFSTWRPTRRSCSAGCRV